MPKKKSTMELIVEVAQAFKRSDDVIAKMRAERERKNHAKKANASSSAG